MVFNLLANFTLINDFGFFRNYFKYELLAKNTIIREDLPPFLSSWIDQSSKECMYTPSQLRIFRTANLIGGGWYLDCPVTFVHTLEEELYKSFDKLGVIDVKVSKFKDLNDMQKRRAIAQRTIADKKKECKEQEI